MSDYEELKSMLESRKAANWLTVDCVSIKQLLGLIGENERLQAKTRTTMGVGSGDGQLFVHGDYDSIKAAQAIVLERDQLKAENEALRKDAGRYRWLRQYEFDIGSFHSTHEHNHQAWFESMDDDQIDACILEEISQEQPK